MRPRGLRRPGPDDRLRARLTAFLQGKDLFVQDCYVGAHPDYRVPIRVINTRAWHNLFARNMFIREKDPDKLPFWWQKK